MNVAANAVVPRFGLIMTDEVRIEGLREICGDGSRCSILTTSLEGVRALDRLDLIVLDGEAVPLLLEAVALLRRAMPKVRILVIGPQVAPPQIEAMIASGAKGYLAYECKVEEVRLAVDVVMDGSVWAPRKVLAILLEKADRERTKIGHAVPRFTARERQVLGLLVRGQSNREIAQGLQIDEGTVKAHLARLMRKARVDNRTALTMQALQGAWVLPEELSR
jgi:DNA-binding NarL/FixJ family response regulator